MTSPKVSKGLEYINGISFILLFFLIRIPNMSIFPQSISFLYSNNLARLLCFVVVVLNVLMGKLTAKLVYILPFVLYILTQTLSVTYAQNIQSFIAAYKDVIFGLFFYLGGLALMQKKERFLAVVISITSINVVIQLILYSNTFFSEVIKILMNSVYVGFFDYQFQRGRFFGDSLDEAFIPILLYAILRPDKKSIFLKMVSLLTIVGITYITFISSWRTKLIIYIFTVVLGFAFSINLVKGLKFIFLFLVFDLIIFSLLSSIRVIPTQNNVLTRIFQEDVENKEIHETRLSLLDNAWKMGLSSPLFGVGLGNYYENLKQTSKIKNKSSEPYSLRRFILIDDPHNSLLSTFASSGLIGVFGFLLLFGLMLKRDILRVITAQKDIFGKMIIVSFWAFFIYSLLNPWIYFAYLSNLWFLRGLVDGRIQNENKI